MSIFQKRFFKPGRLKIKKKAIQEHIYSNNDIHKFTLLLRKSFYPNEWIRKE